MAVAGGPLALGVLRAADVVRRGLRRVVKHVQPKICAMGQEEYVYHLVIVVVVILLMVPAILKIPRLGILVVIIRQERGQMIVEFVVNAHQTSVVMLILRRVLVCVYPLMIVSVPMAIGIVIAIALLTEMFVLPAVVV